MMVRCFRLEDLARDRGGPPWCLCSGEVVGLGCVVGAEARAGAETEILLIRLDHFQLIVLIPKLAKVSIF